MSITERFCKNSYWCLTGSWIRLWYTLQTKGYAYDTPYKRKDTPMINLTNEKIHLSYTLQTKGYAYDNLTKERQISIPTSSHVPETSVFSNFATSPTFSRNITYNKFSSAVTRRQTVTTCCYCTDVPEAHKHT